MNDVQALARTDEIEGIARDCLFVAVGFVIPLLHLAFQRLHFFVLELLLKSGDLLIQSAGICL